MSKINNLLKGISPKSKRASINLPISQWIDELNQNGIVIIDAYVSSKKAENPRGQQTAKLRKLFASGDSNLEPEINEALETMFKPAFYTVGVNANKETVFIVASPSFVDELTENGYSMKPMTKPQRKAKSVSKTQVTDEVEPAIEETEEPLKSSNKGRFKKKNKK